MPTRRWLSLLSGLVAALSIAQFGCAQGCPPLGATVTSAVELTEQQVAEVKAFVECWSAIMNDAKSTPAEVERARDELCRPLNQPGAARLVTPNFRGTYSGFAVPQMQTALGSGDMYRAINAIVVISTLGTDKASNELAKQLDIQNQPAWQIRLRAAEGERLLLLAGLLDARKTGLEARKLRDAILREDNGLVLRNQLAALDAADNSVLTTDQERGQVRGLIGESIASVAKRASEAPQASGPMIAALGASVSRLRLRIADYRREDQQAIGAQLGPALGRALDWGHANWDTVKSDKGMDADMRTLVTSSEGLLQIFDRLLVSPQQRPTPTSNMGDAWRSNDKPKFETGVKSWQDVLSKEPYRPR